MSSRVITSMHFNLNFTITPNFPPPCSVEFTDIAPDGHEEPGGRVLFLDAEAATMWAATDKIAAANALLDARAKALPDLPTIAARMTAMDDMEQQSRALDAQLRAKQAQLAAADEQLAVRATALAAEAAVVATPVVTS